MRNVGQRALTICLTLVVVCPHFADSIDYCTEEWLFEAVVEVCPYAWPNVVKRIQLRRRLGTEHEKLVFLADSRERANYENIANILRGLVDRHGWEPKHEDGNIVGAKVRTRMKVPCIQR